MTMTSAVIALALLEAALKRTGVPLTFITVKGAGHGGSQDPKVPALTRELLAKYLSGQG